MSNSTPVFIDTAFVFALINQRDDWHDPALHWSRLLETERSLLLTTDFILMEIGDGLAAVRSRQHAAQVIQTLRTNAFIEIVPASRSLIEDALLMYQTRADKDWGMTDCSSFVVMHERGITDALTVDRHFRLVSVRFPFSDLSQTKLRPAVVLADAGRGDWILCQVTSKPYGDARAVQLEDASFAVGSLRVMSYARPGKLFTASQGLIVAEVGKLKSGRFRQITDSVVTLCVRLLQNGQFSGRGMALKGAGVGAMLAQYLLRKNPHAAKCPAPTFRRRAHRSHRGPQPHGKVEVQKLYA